MIAQVTAKMLVILFWNTV